MIENWKEWHVYPSESAKRAKEQEKERHRESDKVRLFGEFPDGAVFAHELRVEGGALLFIVDGEIRRAFGPTAWMSVTGPYDYHP